MKTGRYARWISTAIFTACAVRAPGQEVEQGRRLVVGKSGVVNIPTETKVGELTLERGRYRLEHHVDDSVHFVEFTLLSTPYRTGRRAVSGEVACRLEPLGRTASRTVIFTVSEPFVDENSRVFFDRMTKIEIRGENVAHVFSESDER